MAGRVNTKFVFILSGVLVLLVGGVVAAVYIAPRDAQELVARGEQYLAEGEYKLAIETLKRAVHRSKSDPKIIRRFIDVAKQIPAADQVEAGNTILLVRQYTLNLTQIDPDSEQFLKDYADMIEAYVERLGTSAHAHPLYIYQVCVTRLKNNPQDTLARRYRGVYGLIQLNAEMADKDIYLVRDDLEWAHKQYPDDAEVTHNLAQWKIFEASRLDRPGGDPDQAQELKDEALALSRGLLDADPTHTKRKLEYMQVLYRATFDPKAEDRYASIKPVLNELEAQLLKDPQPENVVRTVIQNLKMVYAGDLVADPDAQDEPAAVKKNLGVQRAVALLRAAVAAYPDNATYQLMISTELKQIGEYEQAKSYIDKVQSLSTQGDFLDVLLNYNLKSAASIVEADLLISLGEKSRDDPDVREEMFAKAGKIIEEAVASGRGKQPRVLLLKGRLALAQNNIREGLVSVDEAADLYDAFSREKAEAMLLSARARAQQGDWGAATERYEQILDYNPNIPAIRLQLAGIYFRQRQFDQAQDHLDAVMIEDPLNERALVIQAALQAEQGDLDQAIAIYRELDLENRPDLAMGLGQILIRGDRKAQAARMLKLYFDAAPSNVQLLTVLLNAVDDTEQKRRLIAMSRGAGGDARVLDVLEQRLDPDAAADPTQVIESFVKGQTDPFLRAISAARLYTRAGEGEKARAALAQAVALKPDDKQVIDMRFSFAMSDGDLELAQRLADRAAQMNLDEASGRFYLAQILSAKQDYPEAISTLRVALEDIPINSEGWRMLGDMYVAVSNEPEAITAYEKALKQRPDSLGALKGLAAIRDRQGRHDEALGMIKLGYERYPGNARLRELYLMYEGRYGDKQTTLRLRREIAQEQPDNHDNRRALARLLAETGQPEQGLDAIRGVIEAQGNTPLNLMTLAGVHRIAGDTDLGAQVLRGHIQDQGSKATARDHMMLARYLFQVGDGQGALTSYEQAVAVESDQREASRELAALYFSRGAFDRATPLYRELFSLFPDEQAIGLRLADALIKTQRYDDAAQVLTELGDAGATGDALRALIAESKGDHEEALRLVARAIESAPDKAVLYYERAMILSRDPQRSSEVIQNLNTALSKDPGHLLSRRLLVNMYQKQGQRREAIRELITMVSRHPSYAEGRLRLIQMYARGNDLIRAKALARAGVAQSPKEPAWHGVLAGLALQEGDTPEAIKSYITVFEMAPTPANLLTLAVIEIDHGRSSDALTLLRDRAEMVNKQPLLQAVMGRALLARGKGDQARQVFARAAERSTTLDQLTAVAVQVRKDYSLDEVGSLFEGLAQPLSRVWVDLALARLALSDGEADRVVKRLLAVEPTLSPQDAAERRVIDQLMGPALHSAGRAEEALVYYQRVHEVVPDNTSVLNNMAYLLAEDLDRPGEALPMAERAAELDPKNAQILDTLGWVQFKLGRADEARRTLERSIDVEPLSANHLHLAELLIDQGYNTEAGHHLKTAADLAEQNNETQMLDRTRELLEQINELTEASVTP